MTLPEEAPPIEEIDGVPSVTIPVQFLRNALWYYDNYFIQRDLAETRLNLFNECQSNYQLCIEDLKDEERQTAKLQRQVGIWKGVTIAVGTAGLVTTILVGVMQ